MEIKRMSLDGVDEADIPCYKSADLVSIGVGTASKGNQQKWKTKDNVWYIKSCFEYQNRVWRDDLVECIASAYAKACCNIQSVIYECCLVDGRFASRSMNFLEGNMQFLPFQRLLEREELPISRLDKQSASANFEELCRLLLDITGRDFSVYLYGMALVDCIVGNEDRHYNNFGVLWNPDTFEYSQAPLFDYGLGMFEHDEIYLEAPYRKCVAKMSGKPFASKSERVLEWLIGNPELNSKFLPKSVSVKDFVFPSVKARFLFIDRNRKLGVEVLDV